MRILGAGSSRDDSDHLPQPDVRATVSTEGKVAFLCKCVACEPPFAVERDSRVVLSEALRLSRS